MKGSIVKFKYGTRRKAIEYEKDVIKFWKEDGTFEKSIEQKSVDDSYVFYDGPPFITGNPHFGTLLSSVVKDAVVRYWTMQGKRVERVWGWDCHGLPAENFVEQQLGITDKRDIGTKISLEDYIIKARESMVANSQTWENTIDRIGRWVDFKNSYKTMDKDFMESVWWAFKTLYDAGKIYEGEKVLMYDTKFATPVSKAEVNMDNDAYQTVTDPSVFVKFKLKDEATDLLVWTTTPWTLPANTALAVNPDIKYVKIKVDNYNFILAKNLVEKVFLDEKKRPISYKIIDEFDGKKLVGREYIPSFISDESNLVFGHHGKNAHKVYAADFVEDEGGTGIVHIAPAYGEDDFALAQKEGIPVLHTIDDNGYYLPEFAEKLHAIGVRDTDETGIEVWVSNKFIAKCLEEVGIVWKIDYIQHEYPFNPRSKERIMYRAIPSWFMDIANQKPLMLAQNENINWFPKYLKHGRFANTVEDAPDWALSRNRFWATAMPVWKGDRGTVKVVGSYDELEKLSGKKLDDYHRPWVDDIEFDIDGEHFTRIEEVLDCWFESGSMPFAQLHYPFENKEKFEQNYPADFITEYVAQVRAWFYYVHAINTTLADVDAFGECGEQKNAFKNVIVTGTISGSDGRKMSKSLGNYTDPNELMDKYSADALRFLLLSSPLLNGEDFALQDKDVSDVSRKLSMIWNMYDFFTMYAEVDGWEYDGTGMPELNPDEVSNKLDKWIISRVHYLVEHVTKHMNDYNVPDAMSEFLPVIDDASNWFVRRSRRRFWKSEDDSDKAEAYKTLHYVLVKLVQVLAPFTPFLAEELYQKLVVKESVHLLDFPTNTTMDEKVLDDMARTREIITEGLALRMERDDDFGQIKVRQPLSKLEYPGEKLHAVFEQIIAEEVNVKEVINGSSLALDKNITSELKREGQAREIIRVVQKARKDAGLNVDDRIILEIKTGDNELKQAIDEWRDTIQAETLAVDMFDIKDGYQTTAKIDDMEIEVQLKKEEDK